MEVQQTVQITNEEQPDNLDGLTFRLYHPLDEFGLDQFSQKMTNLFQAQSIIDEIIRDAEENAPDKDGAQIELVPPHVDADMKRIMKIHEDELLSRTKAALEQMKKHS